MKKTTLFLLLSCILTINAYGNTPRKSIIDGYPIANFALTVNASLDGDLYGRIMQNPGKIGGWLENQGSISFGIEKGGKTHLFSQFGEKKIQREFPFVDNEYSKSTLIASQLAVKTFCPLGVNDMATSSLPVFMLEITCKNETQQADNFNIQINPELLLKAEDLTTLTGKQYYGVYNSKIALTCNSKVVYKGGQMQIPVSLRAGEEKQLKISFASYDDLWVSANTFDKVEDIADYVHAKWNILKNSTLAFKEAIPQTGDKELDEYLRWYMIPGISLTKCTKDDEVVTMGYCELNQRDSYWASWLHLALFKDVELRMLEESVEHQQESGKIPTTILPLIERHDDLDINAFFILRLTRFYQYYKDKALLRKQWSSMKSAMDWLMTRDQGDGIPAQVSFWGDWKDVKGVEERKYSPFTGFTYLAALKNMIYLSEELGDKVSSEKYAKAYKVGSEFINKPTDKGGLWNGKYYCQIWKDGSVNDKLLQDQTLGILFDVVPKDRSLSVINHLNEMNDTDYGVCETFPYYPDSFGYKSATYHNGGVWPWLSFMDCWSRIRMNRQAEAVMLIKKVAKADLVDSGDWSPNEHINSLTGENLGFQLQGWNSALFGLVYFGIVNPDIIF